MYIPTPTQTPPPSPQALDLGERIASTVRAYLAENPGIGGTDVTQAFVVARQLLKKELGGIPQQTVAILISVILGVLFLGLFVAGNFAGGWDPRFPMIAVAVVIVAVGVVFVALAKNR